MASSLGPNVSESGLVLCLDAADKNSYSGTGTTWTDLSGNGYNGILVVFLFLMERMIMFKPI
jgi:hypothetical protein